MNTSERVRQQLPFSATLLRALERALPEYLLKQRWFGGKSRAISSVHLSSTAQIEGENAALCILEVRYKDGELDHYQLPLAVGVATEIKAFLTDVSSQVILSFEDDGVETLVYDACLNHRFRTALLQMAVGAPLSESLQTLTSEASIPDALLTAESRISSVEQSNTSILYGDKAILKLYRRIQPGENPDVEIARFLTNTAHYQGTPTYLGAIAWKVDGTTIAFLQKFAPNTGDGWSWMTADLADLYEHVAALKASPTDGTNFVDLFGANIAAARLIALRTAEMHLALGAPTKDHDFIAETHSVGDLEETRIRIERRVGKALEMLQAGLSSLNREDVARTVTLLSLREKLKTLLEPLTGDPQQFGQRIRIHGDYHLGQLLRISDDFLVVDFEGEPGRPIAERRAKHTPLKDVAGMLRSFSYAATFATAKYIENTATDQPLIATWSTAWDRAVSAAFLQSYYEAASVRPDLLPHPHQSQTLLQALLLEKTAYEVMYEMNNRPQWLHLPLEGLLRLVQEAT